MRTANIENKAGPRKMVEANERLYLNKGGDKLVKQGDPEAASLYCRVGKKVDAADLERLGYKPQAAKKKAAKRETKSK